MAAPGDVWRNWIGTISSTFQIGFTGPLLSQVGATARLLWPSLNRWLPGGSAVGGHLASDGSGDLSITKDNLTAILAPTVSNDSTQGYSVGSRWINTVGGQEYVCLSAAVGAAVWKVGSAPAWSYPNSATDPTTPTPTDGSTYYNTVLRMPMAYDSGRAKWLSAESNTFVAGRAGNTNVGIAYYGLDGLIQSAASGFPAHYNGTVISFGYTRSDNDAATFEIMGNGVQLTTVASALVTGINTSLNANFTAGTILWVRNLNPGNTTSNVQCWCRVKWRV